MKDELQKQLFEKYPRIFRQKDLSMRETCMCWGIACDDGWYWLIDHLCSQLQWDTDRNNYPQVEAIQVKEKFGGLRFYVNGANDSQYGTIEFAEFLSVDICEKCGSVDEVTQTKGWIKSLCKRCLDESVRNIQKDTEKMDNKSS